MNNLPISITARKQFANQGKTVAAFRDCLLVQEDKPAISLEVATKLTLLFCLLCLFDDTKVTNVKQMLARLQYSFDDVETWISDYLGFPISDIAHISLENEHVDLVKAIVQQPEYIDTLPYILERLMYTEDEGEEKQKNGVFFTPYDVADHLAAKCIEAFSESSHSFLKQNTVDFSCGTGILLCRLIAVLSAEKNNSKNDIASYALNNIYGADINILATLIAPFLLALHLHHHEITQDVMNTWKVIQRHFRVIDGTKISNEVLKKHEWPTRFGCIIGNPPYGETNQLDSNAQAISNLCVPFIRHGIEYSATPAVMCVIVPLSICYNSKIGYRSLRESMMTDSGSWSIACFDRSPDALFGDDVKTRNAILCRTEGLGHKGIYTTRMMRWSSINRGTLFSSCEYQNIGALSIEEYVPKLGAPIEVDAYKRLLSLTPLKRILVRNSDYSLWIGATGYNSISIFDHDPPVFSHDGTQLINTGMKKIFTQTEEDKYFLLTCLSSTVAYWYWMVMGDGFHISVQSLERMGFSKDEINKDEYTHLVALGMKYAKHLREYPTYSHNAGKIITNYDRSKVNNILDEIDYAIVNYFGMPNSFDKYLKNWYHEMLDCGRSSRKNS